VEPILELERVSFSYQNKYQTVSAVRNVNVSFLEGTLYAIIGKSGSGKTTLLSIMAGLALPTRGHVRYMGTATDEVDLDKYRRENVAVIYQSFNLFPLMTCLENVCYPMELCGSSPKDAAAAASEYIAKVSLPESVHRRFPNMTTGGEQPRIAIPRAMPSAARVHLADAPTGHLDVANRVVVV
jgi:putative ABC transport system ATP-binding protein